MSGSISKMQVKIREGNLHMNCHIQFPVAGGHFSGTVPGRAVGGENLWQVRQVAGLPAAAVRPLLKLSLPVLFRSAWGLLSRLPSSL